MVVALVPKNKLSMWEKMSQTVRKAIIPAAGLGTKFLPATKLQAKEMLT